MFCGGFGGDVGDFVGVDFVYLFGYVVDLCCVDDFVVGGVCVWYW